MSPVRPRVRTPRAAGGGTARRAPACRERSRAASTALLFPLQLLLSAMAVDASPPATVSPGAEDALLTVEGRCPTFSWGVMAGSRRYDLEVLPYDRDQLGDELPATSLRSDGADPVLAIELPGSASSWTPGDPFCLELGRVYAWRLRSHDLVGPGPWSQARVFRLAGVEPEHDRDVEDEVHATENASDPLDLALVADVAHSAWQSEAAGDASTPPPASRTPRVAAAVVDLEGLQSQVRADAQSLTPTSAAAVVGVQTKSLFGLSQPGYGVLGVAIRTTGDAPTVGVRGEASAGNGVEGEGSTGVHGTGLTGVTGVGSVLGGSFLGNGTGIGLRARSGSNDVPDIVLGANGTGAARGIIRSDASFPDADIFLESNDAVVIQLDVDSNTGDSDFIVRNEIGTNLFAVDDGGAVSVLGNVVHGSDRDRKTLHRRVDARVLLERLARLPLYEWSWTAADPEEIHVGPTAQDFQETFGLGSDPRSLATIDLDGVALAAIQGLHDVVRDLHHVVTEQQRELERLRAEMRRAIHGHLDTAPHTTVVTTCREPDSFTIGGSDLAQRP